MIATLNPTRTRPAPPYALAAEVARFRADLAEFRSLSARHRVRLHRLEILFDSLETLKS